MRYAEGEWPVTLRKFFLKVQTLRVCERIASTTPFKLLANPASEGVWFLTEILRAEADNMIEHRNVLRPTSLTVSGDLCTHKVLQVLVICDDIDHVQRGLEVMWPFLEGSEDGEELLS